MYDVCIIGAGPAGSTLARMLGGRMRVLLADARTFEGDESPGGCKPCGGLLAPAAQLELARQGLCVPAEVVDGPQLFAVRAIDADSGIERLYQRHYLNVDRRRLDRWLMSLVPSGVDTLCGWRADRIETDRDGHTVRFRGAGGAHASARAAFVVGADGAGSFVRRALFPRSPRPARYVSVQGEFEPTGVDAYYGSIFAAGLTDYYGWTVPKAGTLLVGGAFLPGRGVPSRFDELVRMARERDIPVGREMRRRSAVLLRPSSPAQIVLAGDRAALVGEAAGLISPSSGEGISYALRSGAALARALAPGVAGAEGRYRLEVAGTAADVTLRMAKSAVVHGTLSRRLIMGSGLSAVRPDVPRALASSFGYR